MDAKEKAWAKRIWDNYKLTPDQYYRILHMQDGVCAACHLAEPVKGRKLAVDHDWVTGEIRGLLCSRCNPILGKVERAFIRFALGKQQEGFTVVHWMVRMGNYMKLHPARQAFGSPIYGYTGRTGTKAHRARLRKERATSRTSSTEVR